MIKILTQTIYTTESHLFYEREKDWIKARDLVDGMLLITNIGAIKIDGVTKEFPEDSIDV